MATKTYYPLDAKISGSELGDMQEDGSAPATATMVTGWIVGTTAPTEYSSLNVTTERTEATFDAVSDLDAALVPNAGLGDSWRTPTALTGAFAATDWDFDWFVRQDTTGGAADGRMRMRVWKDTSADGSTATELTSGAVVGATCTNIGTTAQNSGITWSPGAITLTAQYLFFQLEWEITGGGGGGTADVHFQVGTSRVLTPDFTAGSVVGTSTALRQGRRRRR